MKIERGLILSADGQQLAKNDQQGQYFLREYPFGDLTSPWLGYNNLRYGRAGIERVYNEELTGQAGLLGVTSSWNQILGPEPAGLRSQADRPDGRAAGGREGPGEPQGRGGRARSRAPAPSWPWSRIPGTTPTSSTEHWKDLIADRGPAAPQPGHPGPLSAGIGVQDHRGVGGPADRHGHARDQLRRHGHGHPGRLRRPQLRRQGLRRARLPEGLRQQHQHHLRQGRGRTWAPTPWRATRALSASASRSPGGSAAPPAASPTRRTWTRPTWPRPPSARERCSATPLLMALAACAVANDGKIMKPYIVDQVLSYNGAIVEKTSPSVWLQPITAATAATMKNLMVQVVQQRDGNRRGDKRRPGCRQDRDRRSGRRRVSRLVRRLRSGRRPAGGGGRDGGERRIRRQRRGARSPSRSSRRLWGADGRYGRIR